MPFEDDLGIGRHLQFGADGLDQLGARAAQQAGEGVLGERIGHRRDRAENGCRIGTQRHRYRVGSIRYSRTTRGNPALRRGGSASA